MASANTLTGLINDIYAAWNIVSRELVGYIPAVSIDASAAQAAVGQSIVFPIAPAVSSATSITAASYAPDTGGVTVSYGSATISKSKAVPIMWTGEEQRSVSPIYGNIMQQRFAQGFRTIVNEVELDLHNEAYKNASRAYGTAGTTPFSSTLADLAQLRKILDDNGAPGANDPSMRAFVCDTSAGANLRTLANLGVASYAGTDQTLRQGLLLPVHGFGVRESGQITQHTKGAGTGYDVTSAGAAVGDTSIPVEGGTVNSTGIKAGDIITFAGGTTDSNKYIVTTGTTSTSGTIAVGAPGVKIVKVDADEITIGNSYTPNVGFHRDALKLIARAPIGPTEGDGRMDQMMLADPLTGLVFEITQWGLYRQVHYEIALSWGVKAVNPAHIAVLAG